MADDETRVRFKVSTANASLPGFSICWGGELESICKRLLDLGLQPDQIKIETFTFLEVADEVR